MRSVHLGLGFLLLWTQSSFALSPETVMSRLDGEYSAQQTLQGLPLHVFVRNIDAPAFGANAVYFELRHGGPEGEIEHQHVLVFEKNGPEVSSTTYTLSGGTKYARADAIPARIEALAPQDESVMQQTCRSLWSEDNVGLHGKAQDTRCGLAEIKAHPAGLTFNDQQLDRIAPTDLDTQVEHILLSFEGAFERNPNTGGTEQEQELQSLYTLARRVNLPLFGQHVMYMEFRLGSMDGKVELQRLIRFEDDPERPANVMRSYNFKPGNSYAGAHLEPSKLSDLSFEDLDPLPVGCEHVWHERAGVLIGSVTRETCHIYIPSMDIWRYVSLEYLLDRDSLHMWEQGFDPAGNLRFGTAAPLRYPRIRTSWTAP